MSFLKNLMWRTAEQHFDITKKVNSNNCHKILEAVQMAPTSYGLQPFEVILVEDLATKKQLKKAGFNQAQFEEASHIFIFKNYLNINQRIKSYKKLAEMQGTKASQELDNYILSMQKTLSKMTTEEIENWANKQIYIAIGFALAACAELHIDSCPLEGFEQKKFNQILSIDPPDNSILALAIGYRQNRPPQQKIRLPLNQLIKN